MGDEKKDELVPMNEVQAVDEGDVDEKSPLKEADTENNDVEGKQNGKDSKEDKTKSRTEAILGTAKAKLILALILALVLILLLAIILASVFIFAWSGPEEEAMVYERYLEIIPVPNAEPSMIHFLPGSETQEKGWPELTKQMESLLNDYNETAIEMQNQKKCFSDRDLDPERPCAWLTNEIRQLCNETKSFGYPEAKPCVFIRLHSLVNITFEPFTSEDLKQRNLTDRLANYKVNETHLYFDCKGITTVDDEYMGPIRYAPSSQNIPRWFFPYTEQTNYSSPFFAIKFDTPRQDLVIGVTCRLWAKNIEESEDNESSPFQIFFNLLMN